MTEASQERNRLIDDLRKLQDTVSLENVSTSVRAAAVLAAKLNQPEYRRLFEWHLIGHEADTKGHPLKSWPKGQKQEWPITDAVIFDRRVGDDKVLGLPLEEIELISKRNVSDQAIYQQILVRVRNRVSAFVMEAVDQLHANQPQDLSRSSLTGLPDVKQFKSTLNTVLAGPATEVSLAFIDMDNLKRLNKEITHDRADVVIREMAATLTASVVRRGDLYHRSGDEFLLILEGHTAEEASTFLGRICERVAASTYEQLSVGAVTISVGIAEYPRHASNHEALPEAATRANQAAKVLGKNRVHVFHSEQTDAILAAAESENTSEK